MSLKKEEKKNKK